MKSPFILLLMLFVHFGNAQIPMTLSDTSRPGSLAAQITNEYSARIVASGGTIQTADLNAIGTFVRHAISNGYWSYLSDCSPLAGDNTNAALIKLKVGPSAYTTLVLRGFDATNYSRTTSFFGKTNCWLDTGFKQTNLPYTNHHGAGFWSIDTVTNGVEYFLGLQTVLSGPFFLMSQAESATVDSETVYSYSQALPVGNVVSRASQGMNYFSRTETNRLDFYINGSAAGFSTTAQTSGRTPVTNQFLIYGANAGSGVDVKALQGKMIGWYGFDNGMPATVQSNYYAGVRELMRGLGRIPQPPFPQMTFLVVGQSLAVGSGPGVTAMSNTVRGTTRAVGVGTPIVAYGSADFFRRARSKLTERLIETGWRSYADHLIALCDAAGYGTTNDCLLLNWGRGAQGYVSLKKGSTTTITRGSVTTNIYEFSRMDMVDQKALQNELVGNSLLVGAILSVHGETDRNSTNYANDITQWKTDYETDFKAITGQTGSIPMFHSQTIVQGFPGGTTNKPWSDLKMLELHETGSGSNILVGPKYMLGDSDGIHLTNSGYRVMGEYYAEAVFHKVIKGDGWDCLRPTNVTRSLGTITVTFNKPGLVLDTNVVTDPGNFGFTYFDDTSPPLVTSATLGGATTNQAIVTLASTPVGAGKVIRYAMNATATDTGGPTTGARGCLRDQATSIGTLSGSNLWNYCVIFEKAVP